MANVDWMQRFIDYLRLERQYSEETIRNYQHDVQDFLSFLAATGDKDFLKVTYHDVRIYVGELYDRNYKRTTMQRKMSSLRTFYRYLLQNKQIEENPFDYVVMKKKEQRLPQFFYEKEMEALFQATTGGTPLLMRDNALLETLYASGMRVSECIGLKLTDIDFYGQFFLVHGKGNKERFVPFNKHTMEALRCYLMDSRPVLMKGKQHETVFVNAKGDPLTARGVRYILNQIIHRSSLNANIHPHELRHTFATHLLNHGADMRTVQELLGHVDLSSTQIYAHVTKESLQKTYRHFHPRA